MEGILEVMGAYLTSTECLVIGAFKPWLGHSRSIFTCKFNFLPKVWQKEGGVRID